MNNDGHTLFELLVAVFVVAEFFVWVYMAYLVVSALHKYINS